MNKNILITGSSRGIGKAIAELVHTQNYQVVIHGKTDSTALNKTHQNLEGSIKSFFDVSDKKASYKAIDKILNQVGTIDVLVNNAGIALNLIKDISEVDEDKAL